MNRDDVLKDLDEVEVVELDDQDLDEVAGGLSSNENCGCGGPPVPDFPGGDGNTNCGCTGGGSGIEMM